MADNQASTGDRPSFATYWRTDQRTSTAKELTFVQSVPGQPSDKGMLEIPSRRAVLYLPFYNLNLEPCCNIS